MNLDPLPSWKFHAIVSLLGLSEIVETIISSLDDQSQLVARAKYMWVQNFERNDVLVIQVGAAIGKTPEELDAIWDQAHSLT